MALSTPLHDYWFQHQKIWFIQDPEERDHVNKELFSMFGERWLSLVYTPLHERYISVGSILYLDQLSRHFAELNDKPDVQAMAQNEIQNNSALFMALVLINRHDFDEFTPAMQTFTLLPLRHTRKIAMIDLAINTINRYRNSTYEHPRDRNSESPEIYIRFLRASIAQKLDLLDTEPPELDEGPAPHPDTFVTCLDEDVRERPYVFDSAARLRKRERLNKTIIQPNQSEIQYVSLSGGVDSMVLSFYLKKKGYDVRLLHLVYGNREASLQELEFIRWWARQLDVPLYLRWVTEVTRNQGDRKFYETITRRIRFRFYHQVQMYCGKGPILLGHIMNDLAENFISNVMQGFEVKWGHRGMGAHDIQDQVPIFRPLYWTEKSDIYKFAEQYNIPFTINTTPVWSRRGKLRNQLFPLIVELYGKKSLQNIISFTKHLEELEECAAATQRN